MTTVMPAYLMPQASPASFTGPVKSPDDPDAFAAELKRTTQQVSERADSPDTRTEASDQVVDASQESTDEPQVEAVVTAPSGDAAVPAAAVTEDSNEAASPDTMETTSGAVEAITIAVAIPVAAPLTAGDVTPDVTTAVNVTEVASVGTVTPAQTMATPTDVTAPMAEAAPEPSIPPAQATTVGVPTAPSTSPSADGLTSVPPPSGTSMLFDDSLSAHSSQSIPTPTPLGTTSSQQATMAITNPVASDTPMPDAPTSAAGPAPASANAPSVLAASGTAPRAVSQQPDSPPVATPSPTVDPVVATTSPPVASTATESAAPSTTPTPAILAADDPAAPPQVTGDPRTSPIGEPATPSTQEGESAASAGAPTTNRTQDPTATAVRPEGLELDTGGPRMSAPEGSSSGDARSPVTATSPAVQTTTTMTDTAMPDRPRLELPVSQQLVAHMTGFRGRPDGTYETTLRLSPEELGDVTIRLQVNGGSVSLHALGATVAAVDALRDAMPDLRQDLLRSGLDLVDSQVNQNPSSLARDAQAERDGVRGNDRGPAPAVGSVVSPTESSSPASTDILEGGRVDVRI